MKARIIGGAKSPGRENWILELDGEIGYDYDRETGEPSKHTRYLRVSAAHNRLVYETYLFAADKNGATLDWGELDGSQKATTNIAQVLTEAGYEPWDEPFELPADAYPPMPTRRCLPADA